MKKYMNKFIVLVLSLCAVLLAGASVATASEPSVALNAYGVFLTPAEFEGLMNVLVGIAGVTLAANELRTYELGDRNNLPMIAADIIYQGAAVGIVAGSGHCRPLVAGDLFAGFAIEKADNSAGAAAAVNVYLHANGRIQLAVSGAAITDIDRPVYASDDATFNLTGIGTKIGNITRFVSSGIVIVEFNADKAEKITKLALPITLAGVTAADVLTDLLPGFDGRVISLDFAVTVPVTTAAKAAALHAEIGAVAVTGGVVSLTSANSTPLGAQVADTAITALAAFKKTDNLSIVAAAVTAFAEGEGVLYVTLGQ